MRCQNSKKVYIHFSKDLVVLTVIQVVSTWTSEISREKTDSIVDIQLYKYTSSCFIADLLKSSDVLGHEWIGFLITFTSL